MAPAAGEILEIDAAAATAADNPSRQTVLVLSVKALQTAMGIAVVCSIEQTKAPCKIAPTDLEIKLSEDSPVMGRVLPYDIRTIDCSAYHSQKLGTVSRLTLRMVRARLAALLSL